VSTRRPWTSATEVVVRATETMREVVVPYAPAPAGSRASTSTAVRRDIGGTFDIYTWMPRTLSAPLAH
jgi:hypothetical protein